MTPFGLSLASPELVEALRQAQGERIGSRRTDWITANGLDQGERIGSGRTDWNVSWNRKRSIVCALVARRPRNRSHPSRACKNPANSSKIRTAAGEGNKSFTNQRPALPPFWTAVWDCQSGRQLSARSRRQLGLGVGMLGGRLDWLVN